MSIRSGSKDLLAGQHRQADPVPRDISTAIEPSPGTSGSTICYEDVAVEKERMLSK
jgi:hypothetical protein